MNRDRRARGFTLIELVVVLLLVGLLVSFAVLGFGGASPRERQREEARRILARMDLAREEAVIGARSLGIRFGEDRYRFFERDDGHDWRPIAEGGLLAPHKLPEVMGFEIVLDGLGVNLAGADDADAEGGDAPLLGAPDDDDEDKVRPQIFFLAGGEIIPGFAIRLLSEETDTEYLIAPGEEQWLTLSEERL